MHKVTTSLWPMLQLYRWSFIETGLLQKIKQNVKYLNTKSTVKQQHLAAGSLPTKNVGIKCAFFQQLSCPSFYQLVNSHIDATKRLKEQHCSTGMPAEDNTMDDILYHLVMPFIKQRVRQASPWSHILHTLRHLVTRATGKHTIFTTVLKSYSLAVIAKPMPAITARKAWSINCWIKLED